jgi:hypothetical protein
MALPQDRPYQSDSDRPSRGLVNQTGVDPFSDPDALGRLARQRLAQGDGEGAFALADRRCRLIKPGAGDLFLRAQSHRAAGRMKAAQRDLAAALALDPTDAALDAAALAWGDDALRAEAAERVMARKISSWTLRREAVAAWLAAAPAKISAAHRLRRGEDGVSGWIAWTAPGPLRIVMSEGGHAFDVDPDPDHPLAAPGIFAAEISIEAPEAGALALHVGDGAGETVAPPWEGRARPAAPAPAALEPGDPPVVTVIVPVYEDFEATRACLEALHASPPPFACRTVVVDDASPNTEMRAWLDAQAAQGRSSFSATRAIWASRPPSTGRWRNAAAATRCCSTPTRCCRPAPSSGCGR